MKWMVALLLIIFACDARAVTFFTQRGGLGYPEPTSIPDYQCSPGLTVWVATTGNSGNTGNSFAQALALPSQAVAKLNTAYGANWPGGTCIYVVTGSYTDQITFPARNNGTHTPLGQAWIQCTDSSGNNMDAVIYTAIQSTRCVITGSVNADNTYVFGTSVTTPTDNNLMYYIGVRGFEIIGPTNSTTTSPHSVSCINFAGNGSGAAPNYYGPRGIFVVNNLIHDCGGAGVALLAGEIYEVIGNYAYNTACCDQFAQSAFTIAVPRHNPAFPFLYEDAAMPWKIVVSGNYCFNPLEWQVNRNGGGRTDGECFIYDDPANSQGHGGGSGQTNAGLYLYPALFVNNVAFNAGGNGFQNNDGWYATFAFNDCLSGLNDSANNSSTRPCLALAGGNSNQAYSNIVRAYGPWTGVITSLTVPGPTIHVNDIRGVAQFLVNQGNFVELAVTLSSSNKIPVIVGSNTYNAQSYTIDTTNVCTLAPGCVSGTITMDSNVTVADGQLYNNVEVQVVNNKPGGCTGNGAIGVACQFIGYNQALTSFPGRGSPILTCPGPSDPTCANPVALNATDSQSLAFNNDTLLSDGGGGFIGLNQSAVQGSFGSAIHCPGQPAVPNTKLTACNTIGDPAWINPDYVTTDIAAALSDPQGPAFLLPNSVLPPPPPNLALFSVSPAVATGAAGFVPTAYGTNSTISFVPAIDITGAPRHYAHPNMGAYETRGSPLSFTGIADVGVQAPLLYYSCSVAMTKQYATGRVPACQINCNGDPTTPYLIFLTTSAVFDDAATESVCPGWQAGSNTVHVSRMFEQSQGSSLFGIRQCDLLEPTAANQPTLIYNLVNNKDAVHFDAGGPAFLKLLIAALDPNCGEMFATPSVVTVARRTFGTSNQAVLDTGDLTLPGGATDLGFGGSNQAWWHASVVGGDLFPAQTDGNWAALIATGNPTPGGPTVSCYVAVNNTFDNATCGGNLWGTQMTMGEKGGGGNAVSGDVTLVAVYALTAAQTGAQQILPYALSSTEEQLIYNGALKPLFGLP